MPADLAAKIRRARSEQDGEPRTVTILFVDTVGSVGGSQDLDLEDLHLLVQERTQLMADAVYQYEGTVLQFLGDGIMAVFGAPVAHEDSARRAVSAALTMRDTLGEHAAQKRRAGGPTFAYRIGLHTGPVIVGAIGDDLSMDYLAVGDTVNLAARMEQLAHPGTVCVTEQTRQQAADFFEWRDLGGQDVKGKHGPIRAFEAVRELGARTRFEAARRRGLTPLVGRDAELATLRSYFDQVRAGSGQVASIAGEAGIGKSRLLLEFRQALANEPHVWLQGQCIPYGRSIPYVPIADILRAGFNIDEADPSDRIVEKIVRGTAEWDPQARVSAPYLRFLLSVDPGDDHVARMDALERRAGILEALHAATEQASRGAPLVLVVEDLHWIDERSDEAIQSLIDTIASLPVLFILTYRPGYTTRMVERGYVSRIGLRTLTGAACADVARGVLGCDDLPRDLCAEVMAKAGGNPFYIEEVLRHLVEVGVLAPRNGSYALARPLASADIPGTIQDVIRARMDRLDVSERETLQLAAVIGREFTGRLLSRMTEHGGEPSSELDALQALELILRTTHFPELGYMFKHALTCDVAYQSLLAQRRRALHQLVAGTIEDLYAERLPEHYGTLAHHTYEGQDWPKALEYALRAAEQATERYANQEAITHYDRALAIAERLGTVSSPELREIHKAKAGACWVIGDWDGVDAGWNAVASLARSAGDAEAEGMALAELGFGLMWAHRFDDAVDAAHRALAIAADAGLPNVEAAALVALGQRDALFGNLVESDAGLRRAGRITDDRFPVRWHQRGTMYLSWAASWRGNYAEALRLQEQGPSVHHAEVARFDAMEQLWSECVTLGGSGRYAEACHKLWRALAECARLGDSILQSRILNTLGWIHNEFYDWQHGVEYNQRALALVPNETEHELLGNAKINLGDAAFIAGDLGTAKRTLEGIYDELPGYHRWMKWRYAQHCRHSLGQVLLALGEPDRALDLADECLDMAQRSESRKNIVKARRLRGQVFAARQKPAEAEAECRAALEVARPLGNPPQVWKTYDVLGHALRAQGRDAEARDAFTAAHEVITRTAEGLEDTELKTIFLAAPEVEAIRQAAEA